MRPRFPSLPHPVITIAAAIAFTLPASVALAQAGQGAGPNASSSDSQGAGPSETPGSDAATARPASIGGVVVEVPRPEPEPMIPADKRAAYDADVAKAEAWKRYRRSMPPLSAGTIEQGADYPGLQSLLPPP